MKVPKPLVFALAGWLVGAVAVVVIGFAWPSIFPTVVFVEQYYGSGPSLPAIIGFGLLLASPGGLIGGLIGSRIPREGGRREQFYMAAILGVILSLPPACLILWYFA